ncbi:MAG: Mpo1-like protein, partial [Pseudobdellovibrio sp.]
LHYIGTTVGLLCLIRLAMTGNLIWLGGGLFSGYFFAWIGHFMIEKNRPATFQYPWWSFISDWRMWFEAIVGVFKK